MSIKVQVNTVSCAPGVYTGNDIEHDTAEAAIEAAKDLAGRWTAVKYWRVIRDDGRVVDTNQPLDEIAANTQDADIATEIDRDETQAVKS